MLRTALVTGAARGIGRAIALRLAKDGLNVAVNDLPVNSSDLHKVQQEIEQIGQKSIAIPADVSADKAVEGMMQDAAQKLGSLDVVVANAGIVQVKLLLEITAEEWDTIFAVNMRGTFLCYKEAAKVMIAQGTGGKIIGACSCVAYKPYPMVSHYTASKWGIRGLTQAAAMEWAKHNITVNAYCPGAIQTMMLDTGNEVLSKLSGKSKEELMEDMTKKNLLGRIGKPDDVANLVSFLASKNSDYMTGQSILVDGGMVLS